MQKPPLNYGHPPSAFSLTELLVALAVIAILATIMIPTINRVRDGGQTAKCLSQLRSIGSGMLAYAHENNGLLPLQINSRRFLNPDGTRHPDYGKSWHNKIQPYMSMRNDFLRSKFVCPSAVPAPRNHNETTYAISMFLGADPMAGQLANMTSSIVMVADAPTGNYDTMWPWNYSGYSFSQRDKMFRHSNNTRQNAVFLDGSVRSMNGIEGGAFRSEKSTPNAWAMQGMGYINNGYDTKPSTAQNFR